MSLRQQPRLIKHPIVAPHPQPGSWRCCRSRRRFAQGPNHLLPVRSFSLTIRTLRSRSLTSLPDSAKIPNATQTSVTGLQWFKIYQDGYNPTTKKWAVDTLIANKGKVTFTIPSCISAGQYLLRHELIGESFVPHPSSSDADRCYSPVALHAASSYPGAQLYMECAQLQITGGGSKVPATVSFPGAYKGTDPGIKINIYSPLTNYTIPGELRFYLRVHLLRRVGVIGPAVFTC